MTKQDLIGAEAYIARANRRIEKHRGLIDRSRNEENIATARDLVEVLVALRANVEHQHQRLQGSRR